MMVNHWLKTWAGWWLNPPTPLKNDGVKVRWDDFPFPTEWEKTCSKPPTSYFKGSP